LNTRKERAAQRRRQQRIRNTLFIGGGVLIVVALFFLFVRNSSSMPHVSPAQTGKALSDFSLNDVGGKMIRLSDYSGKVVLVNAWATWCPPCKAEMPALNAYYQAHQADGFELLAVNAGDPVSDAAAFASQKGLAFPVLLDPNTSLLTGLGVHSFPTSIMVGRDGVVKAIHVGMFTPESLETEVTPLLLGQ
jgi:peroxiredoxin